MQIFIRHFFIWFYGFTVVLRFNVYGGPVSKFWIGFELISYLSGNCIDCLINEALSSDFVKQDIQMFIKRLQLTFSNFSKIIINCKCLQYQSSWFHYKQAFNHLLTPKTSH